MKKKEKQLPHGQRALGSYGFVATMMSTRSGAAEGTTGTAWRTKRGSGVRDVGISIDTKTCSTSPARTMKRVTEYLVRWLACVPVHVLQQFYGVQDISSGDLDGRSCNMHIMQHSSSSMIHCPYDSTRHQCSLWLVSGNEESVGVLCGPLTSIEIVSCSSADLVEGSSRY